ncbi:putative tyrosine phosphatase [Leptomonas seymouri]|uniref:diphosphoinositol-polyphosphate diphosphatase n=1 Tax=Leptomonas seymouri TaxID=5684 RepID=A0A0N1HZR3_LEPSE|nr:putative tyrosine phosphatase [Leptomonas seymouri]|eukprot:KPI82973.1 putative tyrosine phosphatase [Leptomonas seymouri]
MCTASTGRLNDFTKAQTHATTAAITPFIDTHRHLAAPEGTDREHKTTSTRPRQIMASSSSPREPLVPTINFSMVCPGVYRSGYPTKKNYSFLCALRLRSILYLCPEDYAESNLKFCEENGIHVLRFPTEGNKEPFNDISEPLMHRILGAICDTRNLPLLIHCNKGKHRTGTVVACLRHLQGWSLVSIFEEYKRFASDKARVGDQQYVELYHPIVKLTPPFVAPWVTITPRVTLVTSDRELMEAEAIQLGTSLLAPDKPQTKAGGGQLKATTITVTPAPITAALSGPSGAPHSASAAQPTPSSPKVQPSSPAATISPAVPATSTDAPPSVAHPPPTPPPVPLPAASLASSSPPPPSPNSKHQQQATPTTAHATSARSSAAPANTSATAAASGGAAGEDATSTAPGGGSNGGAHASTMNSSDDDQAEKRLPSAATRQLPTSVPPPAGLATVPPTPSISHINGGASSQNLIPPLD